MNATATAPATLHVVAPGDVYHRKKAACSRCHRALIPCDVVATPPSSPTITHHACLTQRQQAAYASPVTAPCWYTDSRTLTPCPLPLYNHHLCRDHHAQLCCERKPK